MHSHDRQIHTHTHTQQFLKLAPVVHPDHVCWGKSLEGPWSDIWSLGLLVLSILLGRNTPQDIDKVCVYGYVCTTCVNVVINPQCACAARVTVVGLSVCLSVCLCVCPLVNISLQECLFAFKMLSHTQQATNVKKFVGFSLTLLCSRATALPALYGYHAVGHFLAAEYMCALLKCHIDHGAGFGQ